MIYFSGRLANIWLLVFFFISCKGCAAISHACFMVNKTSNQGACASDWDSIQEKIAEKFSPDGEISDKPSYKVLVTTGSSSTTNQALSYYKQWLEKQEKEDSELLMVAVGGDGTVSDVVQGFFGLERVYFGVLPCGTGNDTARTLGIPVGDMSKAVNILLDGNLKNMGSYLITGPCYGKPDTMDSRVAIEEFDLGVAAEAGAIKGLHDRNENPSKLLSLVPRFLTYKVATALSVLSCPFSPVELMVDGVKKEIPLTLVAAATGPTIGGGVCFFPDMTPDNDLGQVVYFEGIDNLFRLSAEMIKFITIGSGYLKQKEFTHLKISHLKDSPPIPVQVDGDFRLQTPVEVTWKPRSFHFMGGAGD